MFANSSVSVKARYASLFPEEMEKEINGINAPLVLLGDAAYPLLPRLMKPFPDSETLPHPRYITTTVKAEPGW